MSLLDEIQLNFANLSNYSLVINQNSYIIDFEYMGEMYSMFVDKDLKSNYISSQTVNTDQINIDFVNQKKLENIFELIKKNQMRIQSKNERVKRKRSKDIFGIFRERNVFNKCNFDYEILRKNLESSETKSNLSLKSIPKNLLYSRKQIVDIILKELKMVNTDKSHSNFIEPSDKNYEFDMHLILPEKKLDVLLKVNIDPDLYPFYPPTIRYISPSAKQSLVYNLSNLEILKIENWNPTISMNWLVTNLSNEIKNYIDEYILSEDVEILTELDKEIIHFLTLIGENIYQDVKINLRYTKFLLKGDGKNEDRYWKSGTGYGYTGRNDWDIKSYIKEKETKSEKIYNHFINIINLLDEDNINKLLSSQILKFIENNLVNSTLLEINNEIYLFEIILTLVKKMLNWVSLIDNDWLNKVYKGLDILSNDVKPLLENIDDNYKLAYSKLIDLRNELKEILKLDSDKKENLDDDLIIESEVEKYFGLVKSEQELIFNNYTIKSTHRFAKNKNDHLSPKVLMRISSEFSSLRKNLPNNWDSSIVLRGCSENMNIFSFVIIGPKDTPYHNGVFEFHACFPSNYPENEPKVLINTTGNGTVRFNPNLYDCGKVCLSLLGTWRGEEGETWNKQTSTFLQVLISIQSLILVEEPYYNEPGWEREMHTERGKKKSFDYNDNIRINTLKWGIVDQIENPPNGFENFVRNHFESKKEEILDITNTWMMETSKFKDEFKTLINKFKSFYSDELKEVELDCDFDDFKPHTPIGTPPTVSEEDSDEMSIDPPVYDNKFSPMKTTENPKYFLTFVKKSKNNTIIETSEDFKTEEDDKDIDV